MILKKCVTATVLTVASALILTGCGRSAETGSEDDAVAEIGTESATGTVTVWAQGTEGEALQDFVAPFVEANPDVKIEVTPIPWGSAENKYQTAIAGGTTPDVGMLGSDWMPGFADAAAAVPDGIETSDMFPFALESAEFDGELRAVPWYVETRVIFYRSDLMKQAGFDTFPTDWDGLKELAAAYKSKTGAEFGIGLRPGGGGAFSHNLPVAFSGGAELMDADQATWTLDSPAMVDSVEYLDSFFEEGLADTSPEEDSGSALLVSGEVPMFLSGPWDVPGLEAAGGEGFEEKFAVAPIPAPAGGTSTSFAAGGHLAVFKNAENPDAAWKLIQWLSQPEVQVEWFKTVNALPSQQTAWEDSALTGDERVAVFGEQLLSVKIAPTVTSWTEVAVAGDTQIEQVFVGGKSAADAFGELQSTADSLGTGR